MGVSSSPCAQLTACGSCPLLPLSYELQLAQKQSSFVQQLQPLLALIERSNWPLIKDPIASPSPLGYRQSVKLVTQAQSAQPYVGLYQPGTHRVIDTHGCPVQSSAINELLDQLRKALRHPNAPSLYDERSHEGILRYVVIRQAYQHDAQAQQASIELHMTFVIRERNEAVIRFIQRFGDLNPFLVGISIHVNAREGNAIFDWSSEPLMQLVYGKGFLTSSFWLTSQSPLEIRASAESFSQVNPSAAELAYRAVVEGLAPHMGERALDLYCGVGSISLALAQVGCTDVVGLEESPSSIRDAQMNATMNGLDVRFVQGLTEQTLPHEVNRLLKELEITHHDHSTRAIVVSLNPSRRGCQPQVIDELVRLRPRRMAYMSCHPRTLIRDLKHLISKSYFPTSLQLFDLFPGTPHFECVCVIEPRF